MNIYSSKRLSVASRHSPRFPLEQKRREHIQEALVKETVLNDGVAGPEQRGVLSIGRDVCYTTHFGTPLVRWSIFTFYLVIENIYRIRKVNNDANTIREPFRE